MIVLLTGAAGQLGQELLPQLQAFGEVVAADRLVTPGAGRSHTLDLGDLNRVETLLDQVAPDVVVNAAAYTAVDQAEEEADKAFRVNADLPHCLASWCALKDRVLIHYSTDHVFDGRSGRPYRETDMVSPLSVYGESKLAGEKAISASDCRHVILRTSWVYSAQGSNFLLTMLNLARSKPTLSIVDDQRGCPTWARNLATATVQVLNQLGPETAQDPPWGIYHYCDGKAVSWYEFAKAIFHCAEEQGVLSRTPETLPVSSAQYPQKARRPTYSVLETSRIEARFGIVPAGFEESLISCLGAIENNE